MNIGIEIIAVMIGMALSTMTIVGIITKSNVRLESRITRLETSMAFLLHLMKINVAQKSESDGD